MAKGTVYGTTSVENIITKVEWTAIAQGPIANYSIVTQKLYITKTDTGSYYKGEGKFTCHYKTKRSATGNIEQLSKEYTKYVVIENGVWTLCAEHTHEEYHNEDGSCKMVIHWSGKIPDTTLFEESVISETVTLDTIPRASSIDSLSCATSYFTGALTYQYTPKAQSLYNRCDISLNLDGEYIPVKGVKLGRQAASQQTATVTLSSSELSTVYTWLPNTTRGKLRFILRTFSDSEYTNPVGEAGYKEITLTIPNDDSTQPTVTMALSPVSDFTGGGEIYVKGLSKVKAAFTNGAGKYGATIASCKINVEAKDYGSPYDTSAYLTSAYLTTTGSITVKGTVTDSRGYSRTCSETIWVRDYTMPTIDLVSCNTQYFTGEVSFKYTPANDVFYSRCVVALNISGTLTDFKTIDLGVRDAGQKTETFTFTASEIETIYNKYTSSTKGTLRFTYSTYSDDKYSDEVGSATYKEITLSIPNDDTTKPTAELKVSPVSSLKPAFKDLYIKGKTKAEATLANGVGKYGAEIKSYKVTIGAQSDDSPLTSSYLTQAGNVTVTGTVKDSRGFSSTYSTTINVIDYSSPQILPVSGQSSVIVARCDSAGALDENGEYLLIKAKRGYNKVVSGGVQKNFCAMQYCYKVQGGEYGDWIEILARKALSDEVELKLVPGVTLDTKSTYTVQIQVKDDIGETVTTTTHISTQKIYMHRSGTKNSLAIGKYAEVDNAVEIASEFTTIFDGDVQFMGEAWTQLNLSDVAVSDAKIGRCGKGAYYRVCAGGKHIYVAFNVSFAANDGSTISVTKDPIPEEYRPPFDVYAVCPVGFNGGIKSTAIVGVTPGGIVNIYTVNRQLSTMTDVAWIDGYIDYWIKEEEK
jgi:hypothetical protein